MSKSGNDTLPKLTVILPVRQEERFIAQTLRFIQEQDYPRDLLEILVVDGESEDRTAAIVRKLAATDNRIKLLNNPTRRSSGARAIGVSNATGDIVTFVDGHTYIDSTNLLRSIVELMTEKQVSVLSRPQFLDTPDNSFFQKAVSIARKSALGHGLDSTIYTDKDAYVDPSSSGATYRKEVFDKVGNFDIRFDACEDVEFNYRVAKAGFNSFTSRRLAVYYYPRDSFRALFRQLKRYGIGRCRLAAKHRETLSLATLIPFLFVIIMPLLAILGIFSKPALLLFEVALGTYLAATLMASVHQAVRCGVRFFPVLPAIYWTIHWALGWGFFSELLNTARGHGVDFSTPDEMG